MSSFLSRNKLTGVALTMLLEAVVLGALGSWWVRGETKDLHAADSLTQQQIASTQKDIAALESRTASNESAAQRVEDKVLEEMKQMRTEFRNGLERIEDRMDRRGVP